MKRMKVIFTLLLVLLLVFALNACGKNGGGAEGKKEKAAVKYEGEVTEHVLADAVVVKYPSVFKVNEAWTGFDTLCVSKEEENWEVLVSCLEYRPEAPDFKAVEEESKILNSDVKPATFAGKDGFVVNAPEAIKYYAPFDDTRYLHFSCKTKPDKEESNFKAAFENTEVQYIFQNITKK